MERTETIQNLTKSLALFHVKVGKIKKDASNPFFKSSYASLSHILEEIGTPLQESGLVISQFPDGEGLVTMLIHAESGEYISSNYVMPVSKQNDPQALGSAISYARRYAVTSILSLNVSDDDAEGAMKRGAANPKQTKPPYQPKADQPEDNRPWLNKGEQLDKAMEYLRTGQGSIEVIKKKYKISKEIQASLDQVIEKL